MARAVRPWAALAAVVALAGCKDEGKAAAPAGTAADTLRMAVLQAVAGMPGMPKSVQFRGVQVYAQAAPGRTAVCGLVSAFADDPTIFVPFVTVAKQVSEQPRFEFDTHVGNSTGEASRVYLAIVADCWDRGGPAPGRPLALPPLPDTIPDPRLPAALAPAEPTPPAALPTVHTPAGVTGQVAASGSVTVRQSANVRAGPGGAPVRTVAQGTTLHVFAQAPGGWYQVGDASPFGWVHESMLDRQ